MNCKICGSEKRSELIHISQTQTIYFPLVMHPNPPVRNTFNCKFNPIESVDIRKLSKTKIVSNNIGKWDDNAWNSHKEVHQHIIVNMVIVIEYDRVQEMRGKKPLHKLFHAIAQIAWAPWSLPALPPVRDLYL